MRRLRIRRLPGDHLNEKFDGDLAVENATIFSRTDENYLPRQVRRSTIAGIRFGQMVEVQENGCWKWVGATNGVGRPVVGLAGKTRMATHVCLAFVGVRIPESMLIQHVHGSRLERDATDVQSQRLCVNPSHLRVKSSVDTHVKDGIGRLGSRHNAAKTKCVHGHLLDDAHVYVSQRNGRRYVYRYCRACRHLRNERRRVKEVDVDPMDVQILKERGMSNQQIAAELKATVAAVNRAA